MKKILIFASLVIILGAGVYLFDYQRTINEQQKKIADSKIINFNCSQINQIEIQQKQEKIILQKNETGWTILEPIQDIADNDYVESTLKTLCDEKYLAVAKEAQPGETLKLEEYGLTEPVSVITIKNNQNNSKKIQIGSQKNFEGNPFIRIDSENRVLVATPNWLSKVNEKIMSFREKKLYRGQLNNIDKVIITSLTGQFEIEKKDGKWIAPKYPEVVLDQNKTRDVLKTIADTSIQDYLVEGEPSLRVIKEKSLLKPTAKVEFLTEKSRWAVSLNPDPKDKSLNAITERPTNLIKLEISSWEFFGNLSLDSLRDRDTLMRFDIDKVGKIYLKIDKAEVTFIKDKLAWKVQDGTPNSEKITTTEVSKVLNKIHDLQISEFIDKKFVPEFKGSNMAILKSESDNLIYQLNWGPEVKLPLKNKDKIYVLARTQVDPLIFALDDEKILALGLYDLLGLPPPSRPTQPLVILTPRLGGSVLPPKPIAPKPVSPANPNEPTGQPGINSGSQPASPSRTESNP